MTLDFILAFEGGTATDAQIIQAAAQGIQDGTIYQLQGSYHRLARDMKLHGFVTGDGTITERGQAVIDGECAMFSADRFDFSEEPVA